MPSTRTITTITLGFALFAFAACGSPQAAKAQGDDPYTALHQYDSQTRKPVEAIANQIRAAGTAKAAQATIESGLIGVLEDANATFAGKQEAARFLWEVGSAKSVPVLAKMLPDPRLNNIARYALERNVDPSAAAALRAALGAAKGTALVGVINSLGNRADAQAVQPLKKFVSDPDAEVSTATINAIGKIGTPAALAVLRAAPNKSLGVYNAMLKVAERLAATGNRSGSLSLYESLTGASNPAVIRAGALSGLAGLNAPRTGAIALSIAQTATDLTLQRAAARIAGSLSTAADTKRGEAAFSKLPATAQIALLAAWSDRGETTAAQIALAALKSDNPDVRAAAVRAASRIGGAAVVPTLAELAAGGSEAGVARESLARMGGTGVEPALLRLMETGKPEVRTAIIGILAERPTKAAIEALLNTAAGADTRTSTAALKTLSKTAGVDQEARLVQILALTGQEEVRDNAQSAIVAVAQRTGDRNRAAEPLLSALNTASPAGKAAILGALAEVGGDQSFEALTREARSGTAPEEVRMAAFAALADTWSDARALPFLAETARTSKTKNVRVQALRGYLRLAAADGRAPADMRLQRVQEAIALAERPEEKRQALSVVRDIRVPGAIELAAKSLDDPDVVAEASDAILYLAAPQRRGNSNLAAVRGSATDLALDRLINVTKDDNVRSQAQKLRQP